MALTKQIHPLLAPVGGLRYDLPGTLIDDAESPDARNTTIKDGVLIKRYGYRRLGSNLPLSGACIGGDYFEQFSGVKEFIAGTVDDLYKYNSTSENWEIITTGTELDACETGWADGSGDTVAQDTSDKMLGTGSTSITLVSARSDGDLLAYKDISSADISSHTSIGFWIKSSLALSAVDLEIVVSESNHASGEKTGTYAECETTALEADTWTFVRVTKTLTTFNAVLSVSVFANASLSSGLVIRLDDVRAYTEFTGDEDDYLESTAIRDINQTDLWWIFTNGVDPMKKYTGSGSVVDLITSYPSGVTSLLAKQALAFKNHLHIFNVTENGNPYPTRVRWSDTADPGDFINGNAKYQDLTGSDSISRAVRLGADAVCVLRRNSVWVGYATGDTDVFAYEPVVPGLGCPAGRTAQYIRGRVVFLGWDDVYAFDGASYEPIGRPVRTELFAILNLEHVTRSFSVVIGQDSEYWLLIPSRGDTYAYEAFVYNYEIGKWTGHHYFADGFQAAAWYQRQTALTIGDLSGTIGAQDWRFGDMVSRTEAPAHLLLDSSGYAYLYDRMTYDDDDAAIDGYVETKDFILTSLASRQLVLGLDVYLSGGGSLDVYYSVDLGKTWTSAGTLTGQSDFSVAQAFFRIDCSTIRFRFRNSTSGEHIKIREYRVYWKPAGWRLKS